MNRTEIVEAMARAMGQTQVSAYAVDAIWAEDAEMLKRNASRGQQNCFSLAETALTAIEALGMVVVPRVATEAMAAAGFKASMSLSSNVITIGREIWTAMLTAAQTKDTGHD